MLNNWQARGQSLSQAESANLQPNLDDSGLAGSSQNCRGRRDIIYRCRLIAGALFMRFSVTDNGIPETNDSWCLVRPNVGLKDIRQA